ncbi:MAG: RidA family protein [Oscillospiraceae bacterium]|jgi:2-iminobutanoate/2-iminopropanoate deaminase|uniref:RidA family protein n=1 Tax=Candidatus Pseudoscillospira sp. SGI.172 TaxID=3420582 RepID=UPI0009BAA276|nr:RidA family protein [Pseudoflavonifractor sp.]MDY3019544.1 RidA family protein [Oscillospiraceae bacterium]
MNKTIAAQNAPAAVGPYCQAKQCGNTLYTSGQLGLIPATGKLAEGIEGQAKQSLENLGAILKEAGMDYSDVVKTTCLLADIKDFAAFNAVYASYFKGEVPARSCFQVGALPMGGLVEIEVIAVK